jgi:uncharacterized protein YrrD
MQYKQNASIISASGEKLGELNHVVVDPKTIEITHIVLKKGFFFTTDKVIPVEQVVVASEDAITLKEGAENVDSLPDFEETECIPMQGTCHVMEPAR